MPTPRAKAVYDGFQRGAAGAQTGALEARCMSPRMYQMSYSKTLNESVHKQIYAEAAGVRSGGIHARKIKQTTTTNPSRCESVDMIVFARDLDLSRLRNKGGDSKFDGAAGMNSNRVHGRGKEPQYVRQPPIDS
jgi:hypothetical protein